MKSIQYLIILGAAAAVQGACAFRTETTVADFRGRRVAEADRPTVSTEFYKTRRVLLVSRPPVFNKTSGFSFAIEWDDAALAPGEERELQYELPAQGPRAILLVSGDRGRAFYSQKPRGSIRLRQFANRIVAAVDLEFESGMIDPLVVVPEFIFKEDDSHLRITGTFTAETP